MKILKKLSYIALSALMTFSISTASFADSTSSSKNEVITIGANLNQKQKASILNYFGVDQNNPNIIYVNNAQERKYLAGIAPEKQLGHVTMSSAYVVPTNDGGINVKTSNITWVTSSMIATTLSTAGVENANVVAAAPFPVSGTGALTGIIIGFEKSTGDKLTENKKKLANKELVTTGKLANQVGQDKATGIVNDAKTKVIKDDIKDKEKIEKIVKDTANNYNVNLTTGDINIIVNLLSNISNQNYNYKDMKDTLANVSTNVRSNLKDKGENIDVNGIIGKASDWLNNNKEANSFFKQFDDSKLSKDAVVNTTSDGLTNAKQIAGDVANQAKESGLIDKIINFFKSLFN
ncbi:DUF1002 domain-containing protein [Peptostreptococcus equinus]|uniref:DUF1002 domain-containing protein n=1 Tax=Peptostreptococcus equinus TaxID=3003601 RepID=A0ABY7JVG5_9FIRM|nr:DUF1002 domain-containing protein [Peptostreptococcus sp. CBA3647]WAW15697.1 DUF1002 domain-containing protein [Peptostreptococcus sp. CBA3647]